MKEKDSITEKEWVHAGLKCKVVFVRQAHRCGYVAVPKSNPAHNKDYSDIDVDVHGGLTYGNFDNGGYWLGFDCAHAGDKILGLTFSIMESGHFWTLDEVVEETNKLAEQLAVVNPYKILGYEVTEFLRETPEEKLIEWSQKLKLDEVK